MENAKDMLAADAIKTAIKEAKKAIILKRCLVASLIVNLILSILLLGAVL